ncbi:MAG: hypothetical protein DRG31_06950 [Deltaproteobacteria bacterium]|nr:MAG: hypothetical protein DRG31_06950 [Deltaproteobacteria bacterium]
MNRLSFRLRQLLPQPSLLEEVGKLNKKKSLIAGSSGGVGMKTIRISIVNYMVLNKAMDRAFFIALTM